ncbi:zinc-binding dehydrogenase [Streptomyces sp. NPDC060334]|uniref:zinc-binding dehydrogenase n=1 Tax=Streptomyces sp. NPDC060334 TaxID=3347099 RepID=UPI0036484EA8
MTAADALALVRGGLVALSALRAGRFDKGDSVLVTAAASGAGHLAVQLAVQLAKTLGASRVVAAVRSADKAEFVRGCGADAVVIYSQNSWGDPVDLVLDGDGGGGDLVQRGVDALSPHGRLVAFQRGWRHRGRGQPARRPVQRMRRAPMFSRWPPMAADGRRWPHRQYRRGRPAEVLPGRVGHSVEATWSDCGTDCGTAPAGAGGFHPLRQRVTVRTARCRCSSHRRARHAA